MFAYSLSAPKPSLPFLNVAAQVRELASVTCPCWLCFFFPDAVRFRVEGRTLNDPTVVGVLEPLKSILKLTPKRNETLHSLIRFDDRSIVCRAQRKTVEVDGEQIAFVREDLTNVAPRCKGNGLRVLHLDPIFPNRDHTVLPVFENGQVRVRDLPIGIEGEALVEPSVYEFLKHNA